MSKGVCSCRGVGGHCSESRLNCIKASGKPLSEASPGFAVGLYPFTGLKCSGGDQGYPRWIKWGSAADFCHVGPQIECCNRGNTLTSPERSLPSNTTVWNGSIPAEPVRMQIPQLTFEIHLDTKLNLLPLPMVATISVLHKGESYVVQVDLTETVSSFQAQLEELTSVPVENQKLLFKGKKASSKGNGTLEIFGLKDGTKVQMLGSTLKDIGDLRAVEDEKKRMEQVLRNRETQARVRQTTFTSLASRLTVVSA